MRDDAPQVDTGEAISKEMASSVDICERLEKEKGRHGEHS
jgi:hypothetical protein